ncbi:AIR synthase related protein [Alkaliphilus hydrothermalis]|uniref:Selenophosphate synthetase-related protein n=1 Tax=Alkaliphilus hydrothermalis TaxID=1482730 RepID=A0ABS2NTX3_9FIRM|nr:AIR synthase related protein [Alkaliphilus hydrothermalis]MBM7616424.1 selenophosphate synthetase-related protein [Alkaliphilus hydrothermalis]
MGSKYRDVDLVPLPNDDVLVIACDSCGAIGFKEHDVVEAPPFIVGKYTVRVCLMEIFAVGALPIAITVSICNEMEPTGREMIKGIQDELESCNLQLPMTISTEKNMPTTMTAIGVNIVGTCKENHLIHERVSEGDEVYLMGIPKVGQEVLPDQGEIATISDVMMALQWDSVKEIIPLGSSGIKGELDKLWTYTGLDIEMDEDIAIDLEKSAGPCTAVLLFCETPIVEDCNVPLVRLGKLK